jgi:hypothetical protein
MTNDPPSDLETKIDVLETVIELDDHLKKIQEYAQGAAGKPATGDIWADYELGQIVGLAKKLSETLNSKLDPGDKADTAINALRAVTTLYEAAERAQQSSGAEKAQQFADVVSAWSGAVEALPWLIKGLQLSPIFGIYFFYLTKSIEALAHSIGYIEEYYEIATGVWPDVLDPQYLRDLDDATARQAQQARAREAMEVELYNLKVQRWINERAADRTNTRAAMQVCIRRMREKYGETFPATPESVDERMELIGQWQGNAAQAAADSVAARQSGNDAAQQAADKDYAHWSELAQDERARMVEFFDCVHQTLQTYVEAPRAKPAPVAAPVERSGIFGTAWKWWAGAAVAALVAVGVFAGLSGGDPSLSETLSDDAASVGSDQQTDDQAADGQTGTPPSAREEAPEGVAGDSAAEEQATEEEPPLPSHPAAAMVGTYTGELHFTPRPGSPSAVSYTAEFVVVITAEPDGAFSIHLEQRPSGQISTGAFSEQHATFLANGAGDAHNETYVGGLRVTETGQLEFIGTTWGGSAEIASNDPDLVVALAGAQVRNGAIDVDRSVAVYAGFGEARSLEEPGSLEQLQETADQMQDPGADPESAGPIQWLLTVVGHLFPSEA